MITLGPLLIFVGVLALVGTYVSIVHWFITSGEERNDVGKNSPRQSEAGQSQAHSGHQRVLAAANPG